MVMDFFYSVLDIFHSVLDIFHSVMDVYTYITNIQLNLWISYTFLIPNPYNGCKLNK